MLPHPWIRGSRSNGPAERAPSALVTPEPCEGGSEGSTGGNRPIRRIAPGPGHTSYPRSLLVLAFTLPSTLAGCGDLADLFNPPQPGPVFITAVERLSPPLVPEAGLYQPDFIFDIDPAAPSARRAQGFFLNLVTADPDSLQMRLVTGQGNAPTALNRITPPDPAALESLLTWDLPPEARDSLTAGQGIFWLEEPTPGSGLNRRAGVALPDTWTGPSAFLQAYTAATASGDPLQAGQIELARSFYYLAAIGDSVMWGNGLRDPEKFSTLVMDQIQSRTNRRVVRQVHAISGSRILPAPTDVVCPVQCNGEVQTANTSILVQVDLLQRPDVLDLILVDGCINDVGVGAILSPQTTPEALTAQTQSACRDSMLALLQKVRSAAPQARILVTGYYPIVSLESTVPEVVQLLFIQGSDSDVPNLIEIVAAGAKLFLNTAHAGIASAVESANAANPSASPIVFVDPQFGPEHAVFTRQPWLWGLTADRILAQASEQGLTVFPEDPMAAIRATGCFNPNTLVAPISCLYASLGHPNPPGAQQYAARIIDTLQQLGILLQPPTTDN